ncbi:SDR family NAD(P)-dependent oxidoreductase [Nocardia panacis]|uniref:SDR family NAD(P)-dependent oxidoreductase n=1 Tax=Nocardia panacis TaxID=2340916 RepID=A0A3A4KDA7_9NOCA|nr:type I polyketide synthase [Nocardia panacis]RJO70845.1 SDR family NAD(P)-dependent oxidoreductase [Nocardia panacis]
MPNRNDSYDRLLRQALHRIETLERELAAARGADAGREPIAIVGMGCRFPGAPDVAGYWRLLTEGGDAITEVPPDRWDIDAYYDPDPDAPGKMSTRAGGFVGGPAEFDAALFGISAKEADSIDPQQRLLLEVAWEALEDAAIPVRAVPAETGVFVGISNVDYREAMVGAGAQRLDGYFGSGTTTSTASGRLSYFLGATGPALSVDTACSSSAVAIHLAVQNLRAGLCDSALAGGVNRIITPHETISLSKARMMSPDGRCKPFAAAADGYVRGEGCGVLVLRRLSDAERDGNRVLAVVRGTATNQDGHRSGLTVPHGPSQQAVIRAALADGGVAPESVGYVEAHGTGTALGDPIEMAALGAVFGAHPLVVGSVKANIGHLESAAGIAGVIKAVLCVRHGMIPPTLHFDTPNPLIDWDGLPVRVPTELREWSSEGPRVAGVSSFGFSGTNCHVIVEGVPARSAPVLSDDRPAHLLALSGATPEALARGAERMAEFLRGGVDPAQVCFTANSGRSHLTHRRCVVGESAGELADLLAGPDAVRGESAAVAPEVAFLFTGQGAQYPGMGRELYRTQPTFRRAIDACAEILDPLLGRDLVGLLNSESGELDSTGRTQPALFALEYALAELWRSWGVEPSVLLGHSVGELVAACVAGVFSLEDGLRLVAERGRLMQGLPAGGVMVSLRGAPEVVRQVVRDYPLVAVAAINGPQEVVISGDRRQVEAAVAELVRVGLTGRELRVSHAFHSPLMSSIATPLAEAAGRITYAMPRIPLISNVTGELAGAQVCDPEYWVRHAMAPVLFADGLGAAYAAGARAFVEIGPRPVLLGLGRGILPDDVVRLPSLRPDREWAELLGSLAALHVRGVPVDWSAFDGDYRRGREFVAIPSYPFQRERHWFAADSASSDGWLVRTRWAPVDAEPAAVSTESGWVIVCGDDDFAERLALAVDADVSIVGGPGEVARLSARRVVFLADTGAAELPDRVERLTGRLLELVAVLAKSTTPVRLSVVTRGAHVIVPDDRPDPAHTALWGLVRTIAAEYPELAVTAVDFGADPADPDARLLDLANWQGAVRAGVRYAPVLTTGTEPSASMPGSSVRSDGSYLVTGGSGGLGLVVARRLAELGAGCVVLASRSGAVAAEAIAEIRGLGTLVQVVAGDVRVEADVRRMVRTCTDTLPLRGVVHAAGVLDDGPLEDQSPTRIAGVLGPKVRGAWLLDRATRGSSLDFFVAYSSLASLLPTYGSGGYGAANAFLDGLMALRRAQDLPGLAINWGPWAEIGMAAGESAQYEAIGLRTIAPRDGGELAMRLATGPASEAAIGVIPADWGKLARSLIGLVPAGYLTDLAGPQQVAVVAPTLLRELAAAADQREFLDEQVGRILRDVLRSRTPIGPRQGFASLGMDSLLAVEFSERLSVAFEVPLAAIAAFSYPTLEEMVAHLAAELGIDERVAAAEPALSPDHPAPPEPAGASAAELIARAAAKFRQHQNS